MISSAIYLTLALMLAEGTEADGWRGRVGRVVVVAFFSAIVVLIGMSRGYLGVHWPGNMLAGWRFGTAWALVVWVGDRWLGGRVVKELSRHLVVRDNKISFWISDPKRFNAILRVGRVSLS